MHIKKNLFFTSVLISILLTTTLSFGATLAKVEMPDQVDVDGQKLILNGMGLREVNKFGLNISVYVAGLYLKAKSSDSEAIIKSDETKRLVMQFVRNVDREDLLNAFQGGYKDNCKVDCDKASEQFKPLGAAIVSVRNKNQIKMTFYKDRLLFEVEGANNVSKTFSDGALSKNLLSVFINEKNPPTKALRKGLLGIP